MKNFKKIFAATVILSSVMFGNVNVEAADLNFQDLKSKPVMPFLPDRIGRRNEQPPFRYTQRQPKNPPKLKTPSRPTATADRRGSEPPKSFGPPRFR